MASVHTHDKKQRKKERESGIQGQAVRAYRKHCGRSFSPPPPPSPRSMGIPSYFRYIFTHYSSERLLLPPGTESVDRLYLDLNGVIHTCSQALLSQRRERFAQAVPAPPTPSDACSRARAIESWVAQHGAVLREQLHHDICAAVVIAIRRLVTVVCPRELLYLAFDGVAPRAKMEQQRQRRFKKQLMDLQERDVYHRHGQPCLSGLLWDSNCITPGTAFMEQLAAYLREHAEELTHDGKEDCVAVSSAAPRRVVLSDASVPGESTRFSPTYERAVALQPRSCMAWTPIL